jgi:hypothetical protein
VADVMMELNGVRKRVPADKVAYFTQKGAKPVEAAPKPADQPAGPEEAEGPGFFRRAYDAADRLGKKAAEGAEDALTTFGKYGSLGLDDNLAGLAGAAGSLYGMARDEATGFGVNENPRAALATAYREGRDERRAATDAAAERSPIGSAQGALAGTGLQVLTAPASFAGQVATGVVGGVGASDADTPEDAVVPALVGGALGTAGKSVPAVGRLLTRVKGAGSSLLRMAQPAATAGADAVAGGLEALATKADAASPIVRGGLALATGGSSEAGLAGAKGVSSLLRKVTAKAPTGSLVPEMGADDLGPMLQRLRGGADESVEAVASPVPAMGKEDFAALLADMKGGAPLADDAAAAVDDVASPLLRPAAPAPAPEAPASVLRPKPIEPEVITTAGPVAKSPSPGASQPGGIYMPPLQGMDAKIQEAAVRLGTTDLATIANDLKIPTTRIEGNLANLMRQFRFRDAVAKASPTPSQKLAEKAAPDMPADMGSVIRRAKETARSPIDNVSGRNIKQVAAVKQQETWRATYDNLSPDQRSLFLKQIKQETGLPDDTIRQRLKLTKAEWRRLSFDRGGGLSTPRRESVLRPKAEEPNASGGEGESESLTDMEQALLDRNARDAAEAAATVKPKGKPMITIHRATTDPIGRRGAHFTEKLDDASAYTDNPGFGGPDIYSYDIPKSSVLDVSGKKWATELADDVLDTWRSSGVSKLERRAAALDSFAEEEGGTAAEALAREWKDSGYNHVFQVLENDTAAKQALESTWDWVKFTDDFPAGSKTWRYLGSDELAPNVKP